MSSHKSLKPIGDQELALLRFVNEAGQATVGQAAERFGQPRSLARSTVLTMMERLRKKGHLSRRLHEGLYHYAPRTAPGAAVRQAVKSFVDRTLDGSISPSSPISANASASRTKSLPSSSRSSRACRRRRRKKG
jgi:predicted transcriptional regulator